MIDNDYCFFYRFGYDYFGPLLNVFVKWLRKEIEKERIKKVFFLSRDGYIIKEIFDIIYQDDKVETTYLYASRRSILVPAFAEINSINEIFNIMTLPGKIKLSSFLKRLGLDDFELNDILEKYQLDYNKKYVVEEIKKDDNFQKFLEELFETIKNNAITEKNNLINYLKKEKFYGKIAIVDIGWNGTMQNSFNIVTDEDIYGYYIGLNTEKIFLDNKKYKGFLFDFSHDKNRYKEFHYFIDVFEFLFLAQHGSVKKFNEKPVLYEYEYDGKVEENIVKEIQRGAIEFNRNNINIVLNVEDVVKKFSSVFLSPNLDTAINFGDILFKDNEMKYIAKPECSLIQYLFDLKKFKNDFINSGWRIGFLKRLLKIKMPYLWINNTLRKIFIKKGN